MEDELDEILEDDTLEDDIREIIESIGEIL